MLSVFLCLFCWFKEVLLLKEGCCLFYFLVINGFVLSDILPCPLGEDLIIELRQHTDYITGIHSVLFVVSNELTWVDQLKNLLNWLNLIILMV